MCKLMDELWREGKEEGREEGKKENKVEVALLMLRKQFPIELISECTGLSVAEVEKLANPKTA